MKRLTVILKRGGAAIGIFFTLMAAGLGFAQSPPLVIVNRAVVTYIDESGNPGEIQSPAVETVRLGEPLLTVTKLDRPDPVFVGNIIAYTLNVQNSGDLPLTQIVVTDEIPDQTTIVRIDDAGAMDGNTATWRIDTLAPGEQRTFTLEVRVSADAAEGDVIRNTATATANEIPMPAGSSATTVSERTPGQVAFFDVEANPARSYSVGDMICIQVSDADQNLDPEQSETVLVVLTHPVSGDSETVTLTENGLNTGVFYGCIQSAGEPTGPDDNRFTVAPDTGISVTYTDPLDSSPVSEDVALIDPYGVVFDSATGNPVAGAIVTLMNAATNLPADLSGAATGLPYDQDNPVTTPANGAFAFPLVPPGTYYFTVSPGSEYTFPSSVSNPDLPPGFTVVIGSRGEPFTLSVGDPPLNLDIPVDPPAGDLTVFKNADKTSAAVGDILRYVIRITNNGASPAKNLRIMDTLPHGIDYLKKSTRIDDTSHPDPVFNDTRTMTWTLDAIQPGQTLELTYRGVLGPDSHRGTGENTVYAQAESNGITVTSNTARFKVKIDQGVFTSEGVIIGKVYIDRDQNGIQSQASGRKKDQADELGVGGVVLYLEDGTRVTTDSHGKYSIHGISPGTHVLRIDETSLPADLKPVPGTNRFMGNARSQFVDLTPGGLFKANFALIPTDPTDPTSPTTPTIPTIPTNPTGQPQSISPGFEILSPVPGAIITRPNTDIAVKMPIGSVLEVQVNQTLVPESRIGKRMFHEANRMALFEYIGVDLLPGRENVINARIKDPFGNIRGEKEIRVMASGEPARIVIKPETPEIPADGKTQTPVAVSILDQNGHPVGSTRTLTISIAPGEIVDDDADPATPGAQVLCNEGTCRFMIRSPHEPAKAEILASCDRIEEKTDVFFRPHLRGMMVVGAGELTLGHGKTKGNADLIESDKGFDKNTYAKGRGAVFAKGKIAEDVLLTAAYDTAKKKKEDFFEAQTSDPDDESRYPIYGDESKPGHEAPSRDKLYLRLDKDKSHLMYGDFNSDLNASKLGAYTRTFTGANLDADTGRVKFRSFAAETAQVQVVDVLAGKGISGYYRLSSKPVLSGSESVSIETRDRMRPDQVIERKYLARWTDYQIDYDLGLLLFKSPVPGYDAEFNPVYIVVTYESEGDGRKHWVYGGRGSVTVFDWMEWGLTGITEEKDADNYHLFGSDMTFTLPANTLIRAEWARTDSIFDDSGGVNAKTDDAWLFELESKPIEKLKLGAYYRFADDYFDNLSAVDIMRGSRKYGADGQYEIRPDLLLKTKFFNEADLLNDGKYRGAALGLEKSFAKTKMELELSRETSNDAYIPEIDPTTREPFDISEETPDKLTAARIGLEHEFKKDLVLELGHKQDISHNAYQLSQAGVKYRFNAANAVYIREEYGKYEDDKELRTLIGGEKQIAKNTVAFNEYRLESGADGTRNHQAIGLNNRFYLGKKVTGDIALEHLHTLSGDQRTGLPDAWGVSTGLAYLPLEKVKITSRLEFRTEDSDPSRKSWLGEIGSVCKLSDDASLLLKERYFRDDLDGAGTQTTSRTTLGLAYRPLWSDRFNALGKFIYEREDDSVQDPAIDQDAYISSIEGVFQVSRYLQMIAKYAAKWVVDEDVDNHLDMISTRMIYDITDRLDIGAEYRLLQNHDADSYLHGGSLEAGYRVYENLWVSVGYSFDAFDDDLGIEDYWGKGPYVRVRFKFDEDLLRKHLFVGR